MSNVSDNYLDISLIGGWESSVAGKAQPLNSREQWFGAFAEELRLELAPRTALERVLAERVILSAWALQVTTDRELTEIQYELATGESAGENGSAGGDVRPAVQSLGEILDLYRRFRSDEPAYSVPDSAPDRQAGGVSAEPETVSGFEFDTDPGSETEFHPDTDFDTPFDELAHLSNEWPLIAHEQGTDELLDDEDESDPCPAGTSERELSERWQDRLVFDLNVSESSPVVRGTWVTVSHVVSLIVDGWTWSNILRTHPELTEEDIRTCLAYTVAEENDDL